MNAKAMFHQHDANDRRYIVNKTQRQEKWPNDAGVTLMELLIVLTVLALLATIATPQLLRFLSGAKSRTAATQIENLVSATELYFLDTGQYPSEAEGLKILVERPSGAQTWNGPYLSKSGGVIDPWGNPYKLRIPGRVADFEIFTFGADGVEGGESEAKDLYSWEN